MPILAGIFLLFAGVACGEAPGGGFEGQPGSAEAQAVQPYPAGIGSIAVEDFTGVEIQNARGALPLLAQKGIAVVLHWKASDLDNLERWNFAAEAAAQGVEVRPWLLLSEAEGYWPGSTNAPLFASKARQLAALWKSRGLPPTTFVVDMEMRIDRYRKLNEMISAPIPNVLAIAWFLRSGINRWQYYQATLTYAALVNDLHQAGWRVHLTTLPQVADDYSDGDDGLRQALGIPVDGIAWDAVSIQAYRTLFSAYSFVGPLTPFFVYDYGRMAQQVWGTRAAIDIGITGNGMDSAPTYVDGNDMRKDVEAALSAGFFADEIFVYNLQGILDKPPASSWFEAPNEDAPPPPLDLGTPAVHTLSIALDLTL
ncbi:MAG: hypothetical protein AB1405_09165 [Bdellovibrionota bacterium]